MYVLEQQEKKTDESRIISDISEGNILYTGLNYDPTNKITKKRNTLILYLDTEIIFDIAGYNGEMYQELAQEFIKQIRSINGKDYSISLRYFSDIENEINKYFFSAEQFKRNNSYESEYPRIAMKHIINLCKEPSDVQIRKRNFLPLQPHIIRLIVQKRKTE